MTTLRHIFAPLLILMTMLCLPHKTAAQDMPVMSDSTSFAIADSLHRATAMDLQQLSENSDSANQQVLPYREDLGGSVPTRRQLRLANFMPDPAKATWSALVFPGGGQIYNHKYWKLPIVYGGFLGCAYALNWNNQMYSDYSQAYLDIMDSDPNTDSYKDFFRPGYDYEANKEYLTNVFKKRKDRYRRWRDLSIFAFIGVYAVSVIDAYVDAQLSSFDIAEDINLTIEPQRIRGNGEFMQHDYYGLNFNISF